MSTVHQTSPNGEITLDYIMQRDLTFRYMLLGRLQADCEYYLGFGNRNTKRLWAGSEERQIDFMIKLYILVQPSFLYNGGRNLAGTILFYFMRNGADLFFFVHGTLILSDKFEIPTVEIKVSHLFLKMQP